jgi:hypothetical protein
MHSNKLKPSKSVVYSILLELCILVGMVVLQVALGVWKNPVHHGCDLSTIIMWTGFDYLTFYDLNEENSGVRGHSNRKTTSSRV